MMQRAAHISAKGLLQQMQVKTQDFAKTVLVSGQLQRAKKCLEYLDKPVKNFSVFGYTFWTGAYKGYKVTVGNGGLYSPDTALVTELLCAAGIEFLIRLGSCGALKDNMQIGDIVIADFALRGDGVTNYYVSDDFIPQATKETTDKFYQKFSLNMTVHRGSVWTTDALLRETPQIINPVIKKGAIAVDMVTSPFFTIASIYKKKCAASLVVSDNLITGEMGFASAKLLAAESKMITDALELVKGLEENK